MGRDAGIGVGLLVFCGILYWQAGLVSIPPFIPIGPSFYPTGRPGPVGGPGGMADRGGYSQEAGDGARNKKPAGPTPNYRRVALAFFVFLGYVACLDLIGYMASTFLFVLGLSWAIGPRNIREMPKLVAVAVGTALVTYVVFERYLYVFLPRGLLF